MGLRKLVPANCVCVSRLPAEGKPLDIFKEFYKPATCRWADEAIPDPDLRAAVTYFTGADETRAYFNKMNGLTYACRCPSHYASRGSSAVAGHGDVRLDIRLRLSLCGVSAVLSPGLPINIARLARQ